MQKSFHLSSYTFFNEDLKAHKEIARHLNTELFARQLSKERDFKENAFTLLTLGLHPKVLKNILQIIDKESLANQISMQEDFMTTLHCVFLVCRADRKVGEEIAKSIKSEGLANAVYTTLEVLSSKEEFETVFQELEDNYCMGDPKAREELLKATKRLENAYSSFSTILELIGIEKEVKAYFESLEKLLTLKNES